MSASANISRFIKGSQKAMAAKTRAAVGAVDVFGEHVIGDSQQITPVLTGFLQASGTTQPAELVDGGKRIEKVVGHNASYAAAVHHLHPTQAHFLRIAVENNRPKFAPFVAARVKRAGGA